MFLMGEFSLFLCSLFCDVAERLTVAQGVEPQQLVCDAQPVGCYAGTGVQRRDEHGGRRAVYLGGYHHDNEHGERSCPDPTDPD
jgi:hypothetical protein